MTTKNDNFRYAILRTEPRFPGSRADIQAFRTEKEMKDWLNEELEYLHDLMYREEGVYLIARDFQNYHSCAHAYDFDLIPEVAEDEPENIYYQYDCFKICSDGHGVILPVAWDRRKVPHIKLRKRKFVKVF